jgi:serine/threonine protein kinase/formylglycine-generating enzyme required for sulfatase activity
MNTTCPTDDQLRAFQTGSAAEDELDATAAHLRNCPGCLRRLERLAVPQDPMLAALRDLPRTPHAPPTPDDPAYLRALVSLTGQAPGSLPGAAVGPGTVLGEYRLVERLGEGGMGIVWKAVHNRLGKPVALKTIHRRRLGDPEAVARFEREMKAVGRLDHPNIVRATDAGETGGVHFLVMEFVEGTNLSRLVKFGGPLPVQEACRLIREAAVGLQHAHAAGLIHRDVKPSNLMRAADGSVKVLDLGLARLASDGDVAAAADAESLSSPGASDVTSASRMIGTLNYMAPEQKRDARAVDPRADVYGLGATLWFLLTGQPPGAGETDGAGPLPGGLPTAMWTKLLAAEPASRYPSAASVAEALASFTSATGKGRRDRRAWLAVAVAGVAVVVLGVLQPWRSRTAETPPTLPVGKLPMTPEEAKELQAAWAKEVDRPLTIENGVGMKFALIPPGEFGMSSQCRVRLTKPFYLGTCEVTHGQFRRFVTEAKYTTTAEASGKGGIKLIPDFKPTGGRPKVLSQPNWVWTTPGHEEVTDDHPVCQVSWTDAEAFCRWLSTKDGAKYRLPTESELTWATRCGNESDGPIAPATEEAKALGWHYYNTTHPEPVGRLRANPWGLYDTLGNVAEWVQDRAAVLPAGPLFIDYSGPAEVPHNRRVFFGYSYLTPVFKYQFRDQGEASAGFAHVGFRVARDVK